MAEFDDGSGSGPAIYAAGDFTDAGLAATSRIAKWDGSSWSALGSGLNATPYAMAVFDDGSGPALFAAGFNLGAEGVDSTGIVKWDGSSWSAVGGGILVGFRCSMVVFDDGTGPALYVAGEVNQAGGIDVDGIAKWDGTAWSAVGSGFQGDGYFPYIGDLLVHDDGSGATLYACGRFDSAGETQVRGIARWDGTSWSAVGPGFPNNFNGADAMAVFDDGSGPALHVAGVDNSLVFKWDGGAWTFVTEHNDHVEDMTVFDDGSGDGPALIVAGRFTRVGNLFEDEIAYIAKWDGSSWSSLGSGVDDVVNALLVFDNGLPGPSGLYVGGRFSETGGVVATGSFAKWDGAGWAGTEINDQVNVVATLDDGPGAGPSLYIGGAFTRVPGVRTGSIARWDGVSWSALGEGLYPSGITGVTAITMFDDSSGAGPALYAAGVFRIGQDGPASVRVAKWDGSSWSSISDGMLGTPYAMEVFDDGSGNGAALYVGGFILGEVNGVPISRIARWDGSEWSAVGANLNGTPRSLAVFDDGLGGGPALYAGGVDVSQSGEVTGLNNIARWDGTAWSGVGGGVGGGAIATLHVSDDGSGPALYAGGSFTSAGGVSANRIAKWDGFAWSAFDTGTDGPVIAITTFDDGTGNGEALYAAGNFSIAGGSAASRIARWDGSSWSRLGGAGDIFNGIIFGLGAFDDGSGRSLFVGGNFAPPSPNATFYLAKWQGCAVEIACPPDVTGDGQVNLADLNLVLANFGQQTSDGDSNGDGVVNLADLNAVLAAFGTSCP